MSSLRILHVVFSSRLAGSERYCVDLANRQAESGHEVHVAGMRGSPIESALDPRVKFHGFSTRFFRRFLLRRLVENLGVDVCHGHLSAACKALGRTSDLTATVATLHVGYKAHQHARLDAVICVNHAQSARLHEYRGLARTIPNWLPQVRTDSTACGLRQELGVNQKAFVIGAVGRLHASKGMDVLISAFQAAAPADAALVILGEGPQRAELERLCGADRRIHLAGYRADVQDCLRSFDLFVSPSREESFGLAILEAMNTGLPVISTAAEGPAEFLRDQPVTLVQPGSVDELANAIALAGEKFAASALPRVAYDLSRFEPTDRLASIDELYTQVLKVKSRSRSKQESAAVVAT
jgi:glycosyltransferase involved in cell wall biosynthesis